MRPSAREKFQALLRELFEFDCADLDFGIYRIMNHKRQVIERFIAEDLPKAIAEELRRGALAEQGQAQQTLAAARQKVLDALGNDALDADGNLAETYRNTPAGKAYLEAQAKAQGSRSTEALEAAIYNHLYTFFSRYWQDGDFISKRRYSKKERYAIPYNGEEVTLYWANHDQYYVKTGEYFTDYTYQAPNGVTVHFKLQQADVEQNNVKGEKRFFLPVLDGITWDKATRTLTIPFHFRPLTGQEAIAYGQKNQQEAIIAKAVAEIPKRVEAAARRQPGTADVSTGTADVPSANIAGSMDVPSANIAGIADVPSANIAISSLEYHLRQYTRRNTSDFFIHKDLKGFLSRELDFYLKNEVLNLEEMEAAGEQLAEGWFQLLRLIKRVGLTIIDFLAQIEDFQKMLWEKKKFVTETFYVITVGNIPETFYPEIAVCEAQWEEWKALGFLDEESGSSAFSASSSAQHKGWRSRGYLPHFDSAQTFQFITFRLHDSVPAEVIAGWKTELRWTEQTKPDSKEAVELRKRVEQYVDSGHGACHLRDERIARLVQEALKQFDGKRYRLIAWCIMPNHVHVLIEMKNTPLADIVKSWKSYTAHEANKLLGRSGHFWGPDYYDRYIRDEKHFHATVEYVLQNPVKAGLTDAPEKWPWTGSADVTSVSKSGRDARAPRDGERDARAPRISLLKAHPTLPLDTRHFPTDFTDRLLASFDNLDDLTDGLLVHSENWQALNLLREKYRERVKCIYIDPPYNTGSDEFLYLDAYQHSSWLAMIENTLGIASNFLMRAGLAFINIDEREQSRLEILLQTILGSGNTLGPFIWLARAGKAVTERQLQVAHEYILCAGKSVTDVHLKLEEKEVKNCRYSDERGGYNRELLRQWGGQHDRREDRPTMYFPIPSPFGVEVYPKRPDGSDGCWRASREQVQKMLQDGDLDFVRDDKTGEIAVYRKIREGSVTLSAPSNIFDDCGTSATATMELKALFADKVFETAKPVNLAKRSISLVADGNSDFILDFFAGSGTTGHAVINLNREDGGRRKFILVEMAHYFDTVLLPRIKKVTFTPEWRDGKPERLATPEEAERSPRIVKVIRLESYEDALNNLTFDEESGQQALDLFKDEYLLHYMLKWETRHSETLLDVAQLQTPFSYKLRIHRDGETRERAVDLPETFACLLGLEVQTRKVYECRRDAFAPWSADVPSVGPGSADVPSAKHHYHYLIYRGALRNGRTVVVIWRKTKGWTKEDYERDRDFVAEQKLTEGADEVFVNGDSLLPGAQSLDPLFKERMFAGVEA